MQAEEIIIHEAVKVIKANRAMLDNSYFDDISFKNVKITNANMSSLEIEGAQLGGAYIHNIGMPPKGHPMYDPEKKQLPLRFENCNLTASTFDDISFRNVKITNTNMSGAEIENTQLGGAYIHNVGMPPKGHPMYDPEKKQQPLRFEDCKLPVRFEDCNLTGSTINDCNLSGVVIDDCNLAGMTINGILVEELLEAYNRK
jgi:uncharacterized protein YjbI with pentapeptide repeats